MWAARIQNFHMAALAAMIGSETNDTFSPLEILLPGVTLGFYSEEDFKDLDISILAGEEQKQETLQNEAWKTIMAKTGVEQQYDLLSVLELGMENKVAFNCYTYQPETRKVIQFGDQKTETGQNINMIGRHETQSFFINQQHFHNLQSASKCQEKSLTEAERHAVESYADKVADEENPATALDFVILTKGNLLEGKGICVTVVDDKGKVLSEETYPGTDPKSGNIKLLLTKTPLTSQQDEGIFSKLKRRVMGKDIQYSGHVDILRPDGSREKVNSSDQNCVFHAIIQATTDDPHIDVKEEARQLRNKVSEKLRSEPNMWGKAVQIQNMFDITNRNNKFKIEAGVRKGDEKKYKTKVKNMKAKEIIKDYKLGEVDEYKNLQNGTKPTPGVVEADHIPPKDTMIKVLESLKKSETKALPAELQEKNKGFYDLIKKSHDDKKGKTLICMNTLHFDHKRALTTGNSKESRECRKLLAQTFQSGDVLKALKLSLIMAHPICSDQIRKDLGIKRNFRTFDSGLSEDDTNSYYNKGFENIVKKYCDIKVIDQEEANKLQSFIKNLPHNFELSEYTEINDAIEKAKARTGCISFLFK